MAQISKDHGFFSKARIKNKSDGGELFTELKTNVYFASFDLRHGHKQRIHLKTNFNFSL